MQARHFSHDFPGSLIALCFLPLGGTEAVIQAPISNAKICSKCNLQRLFIECAQYFFPQTNLLCLCVTKTAYWDGLVTASQAALMLDRSA